MASSNVLTDTEGVPQEIERKFVPPTVPAIIDGDDGEHLQQGYLAEEGQVSVRLRITPESAVLTIKAGTGRSRTEVEFGVGADEAAALWPHTAGRRIDKTRHRTPLADGHVAEIDVYHGDLDGLCTIEVEFGSDDAADAFSPPPWFGREVTGLAGWTNAALSRGGRPI